MKPLTDRTKERMLDEKTENLIAIGAATASNCIPCFEHIYEKAITTGVNVAEIRRASEIAAQVKTGAHMALTHTITELIGDKEADDSPCPQMANKSCSC